MGCSGSKSADGHAYVLGSARRTKQFLNRDNVMYRTEKQESWRFGRIARENGRAHFSIIDDEDNSEVRITDRIKIRWSFQQDPQNLSKLVAELSRLDPATVPLEKKLDFARQLLRGINLRWVEEIWQGELPGAFQIQGDRLKQAKLYTKQLFSLAQIEGFVSHAWSADAGERGECLKSLLYDCFGIPKGQSNDKAAGAPLWIDKFSSPQEGAPFTQAKRFKFFFIEYMAICPRAFVLLSPNYLTRLWCRYEFVVFLALHDVDCLFIGMDAFREDPDWWQQYKDSIYNATTQNAGCSNPEDRKILQDLIDENFVGREYVDDFIRYSAIALMARTTIAGCSSPGRSDDWKDTVAKQVSLAQELGYHDLVQSLQLLANFAAKSMGRLNNNQMAQDVQREFKRHINPRMVERQHALLRQGSPLAQLRQLSTRPNQATPNMPAGVRCSANGVGMGMYGLEREPGSYAQSAGGFGNGVPTDVNNVPFDVGPYAQPTGSYYNGGAPAYHGGYELQYAQSAGGYGHGSGAPAYDHGYGTQYDYEPEPAQQEEALWTKAKRLARERPEYSFSDWMGFLQKGGDPNQV
eukprot:TRINITY_DN9466_c0_g1_i1.p1 TRINITY_DN9466_c0_g1~~TRINITY_DN9466_c0_g1_i1.p1  ORF type:complete len:578 (-),score=90.17 TRINITY_DN9466_c0_g1_i1:181-1914(-)